MTEAKELTIEEQLKEIQKEYHRLCTQWGHESAQILQAANTIERIEIQRDKTEHAIKELHKKGDQLETKRQFEQQKVEKQIEAEKEVSNG